MSQKVTLPGLVARLAVNTGDTKKQTEDFIKELFNVISDTLQNGGMVKVRDLGVFKTIEVEPRKSVNVSTGEDYMIAGHRKVVFIPGKELAALVNEPFEMFQTVELPDEVINDLDQPDDLQASECVASEEPDSVDLSDALNDSEPEPDSVLGPELESESESESESDSLSNTDVSEDSSSDEDEGSLYRLTEPDAGTESIETLTDPGTETITVDTDPDIHDTTADLPVEPEDKRAEAVFDEVVSRGGRKRFWTGYFIGVLSCLVLAGLGFALYFYSGFGFKGASVATVTKVEPMSEDSIHVESKAAVDRTLDGSSDTTDVKPSIAETVEVNKEDLSDRTVPTAPSDRKVYDTISRTGYLTTMAKDHYGNYHLWPYIYKENEKFLGHPDRIRPGTQVVIPDLKKYGVNPNSKSDIEKAKRLGNDIYSRYR